MSLEIASFILALNQVKINHQTKNQTIGADFLLINRSGKIKLFDHLNNTVYTEASIKDWNDNLEKLNRPIFKYFKAPESKLFKNKNGVFIADELVSASVMGVYKAQKQKHIYSKVIQAYTKYLINHRCEPQPEIIQNSYYEIMKYMPENVLSEYKSYETLIIDYSKRCYLVEAHLDFSIDNFLYDDITVEVFLLDNEDLGLLLPGMIDVINLSLNEIYHDRNPFLLNALQNNAFINEIKHIMASNLIHVKENDLKLTIFVNCFMRESSYVSSGLKIAGPSYERIKKRWNSFKMNIRDW